MNSSAYYAESWLLTHYLQRAPGQSEKLRAYLRAVAAGADPVAAFEAYVDPDIRAFELRLKSYLNSRKITYSRFDRPEIDAGQCQRHHPVTRRRPFGSDARLARILNSR